MMTTPLGDHSSSRDIRAIVAGDTSGFFGGRTNPLWLLVAASALFFAFAAALLASG